MFLALPPAPFPMPIRLPAPSERGLPGGGAGEPAWLGSGEARCFAGGTVPDAGLAPSLSAPTSAHPAEMVQRLFLLDGLLAADRWARTSALKMRLQSLTGGDELDFYALCCISLSLAVPLLCIG